MTPAEKLLDFFSREDKWCKGSFYKDEKDVHIPTSDVIDKTKIPYRCCLSGAIGYLDLPHAYREKIRELINEQVVSWNDDPSRTFKDIQKLCKKLLEWEKEYYGISIE